MFLSNEFGKLLMTRYNYGGVIDVLESSHLEKVKIPILKNEKIQHLINSKALEAVSLRNLAYNLEKKALDKFENFIY